MCVCMCVFVCACPETVSAVLEFTFCSYCNHNHFTCLDVCICDSLHVCVSTPSIDILQYCDIDVCVCACVPACKY